MHCGHLTPRAKKAEAASRRALCTDQRQETPYVPSPRSGVGGTSTRLRLAKIETLIATRVVQTLPIASREHGRSVSAT